LLSVKRLYPRSVHRAPWPTLVLVLFPMPVAGHDGLWHIIIILLRGCEIMRRRFFPPYFRIYAGYHAYFDWPANPYSPFVLRTDRSSDGSKSAETCPSGSAWSHLSTFEPLKDCVLGPGHDKRYRGGVDHLWDRSGLDDSGFCKDGNCCKHHAVDFNICISCLLEGTIGGGSFLIIGWHS